MSGYKYPDDPLLPVQAPAPPTTDRAVVLRDPRGRLLPGTKKVGGRRKGIATCAAEILARTNDGVDVIEFFDRIFRNVAQATDPATGRPAVDADGEPVLARAAYSDEQRERAALWLADRAWGKAVSTIDMAAVVAQYDGPQGALIGAVDVESLDEAELLALDAILRRAASPRRAILDVPPEDALEVIEDPEPEGAPTRADAPQDVAPARPAPRVPVVL